jgi:DNA-binding IclR family transcriptional regulator
MIVHPHDLGAFSLDLGLASTAQIDAVRLARPVVEELSRQLDAAVGLAVWGNHGPTMIQWEDGSQYVAVALRTGLVLPLLTSATGLVFAAYLPRPLTDGFIQAELTGAAQTKTGEGPKTREQVEAMLQEVRNRGIARAIATIVPSVNEQGINAFSAPIFNSNGNPVFALTIMGHSDRFDGSWHNPGLVHLQDVAKQLSRRLGHQERTAVEAT